MTSSRREGLAEEQTRGPEISFVIGNTYEIIPLSKAEKNRDGRNPKVHDWILYVDVFGGDPDIIKSVKFDLPPSFQPSSFSCYYPVRTVLPDSSIVLRFKTRQQSAQSARGLHATITIFGIGGTTTKMEHKLILSGSGVRESGTPRFFIEERPTRPLTMVPLPSQCSFAIDLTLLFSQTLKCDELESIIQEKTNEEWKFLVNNERKSCYADHKKNISNCFSILSPVLHSNIGFEKYKSLLRGLQRLEPFSADLNGHMGFQVKVDVSKMTLTMLTKVCQNFIKYEEAIDAIMPSPRMSSGVDKTCILSNKEAVLGSNYSNIKKHKALSNCSTIEDLVSLMNPNNDAHYRLDLREPKKIKFHQNFEKTTFDEKVHTAWVAFCLAFVHNSARFRPPSSLHESRSIDDQFDFLFEYVIKDRALEQIYKRSRENNNVDERTYCEIFSDSEEEVVSDLCSEDFEQSIEEVTVVEDDIDFENIWEGNLEFEYNWDDQQKIISNMQFVS